MKSTQNKPTWRLWKRTDGVMLREVRIGRQRATIYEHSDGTAPDCRYEILTRDGWTTPYNTAEVLDVDRASTPVYHRAQDDAKAIRDRAREAAAVQS